MVKNVFKIFLFVVFAQSILFGQFGKNKVQYKGFTWYYVQTKHFDIYFSQKRARTLQGLLQKQQNEL